MVEMKHWQDPFNALAGLAVAISPWALNQADDRGFMVNMVLVGLLLVGVALASIFMPRFWEEWVEGALGLWLLVSPWIVGFADTRMAMLAAVVGGLVIVVLAAWALLNDIVQRPDARRIMGH